jgi:hypothetical protein
MAAKPYKIIVTVEVEVTDTRNVLAEARKVARGRKPNSRKLALMDLVEHHIASTPGLELAGMSARKVAWFDLDEILDIRHPMYKRPGVKSGRRTRATP